ncbi:MAG: type II toxin-antitoxin system VapC family toxin [Defluviitaleaceae bacterium]|nr:type II toxin-antitoxin system VapC family toxin [Defluviitaleaceae bacterium]MCL2240754.1 type II toxin-antitoxin system VapC family toxin [Defluviitaleaceae bacterium]
MTYALDSNIISHLLKDNDRVYAHYFDTLSQGHVCVIPLVVYYEVRRGLKANDARKKMGSFEKLCTVLGMDDLTQADMNTAADIYAERKRRGAPIDDTDLLIAAQCLTRGYTLVTNNTKHFTDIDGLQLVDWTK